MKRHRKSSINRKEFLYLSSGGLLGVSIAEHPSLALAEKVFDPKKVEYRTLGRTNLKVTAVGFAGSRTVEPTLLKRAIDMGVNFIDAGRVYFEGKSEEMIGKVTEGIRKSIIIQTKFECEDDRTVIEKSIDESLKALRTDYIDIMLRHGGDTEKRLTSDEVLEAITKAKKAGKIRFCGFSCHNSIKSLDIAREMGLMGFYDVAMFPYNHANSYYNNPIGGKEPVDLSGPANKWDKTEVDKLIEVAVASGMGIVAMKTCYAGPLKEEGESKATYTTALKWILRNKNISAVMPAMGNFREIEDDVAAMWD